jgi:hypothetical protein
MIGGKFLRASNLSYSTRRHGLCTLGARATPSQNRPHLRQDAYHVAPKNNPAGAGLNSPKRLRCIGYRERDCYGDPHSSDGVTDGMKISTFGYHTSAAPSDSMFSEPVVTG